MTKHVDRHAFLDHLSTQVLEELLLERDLKIAGLNQRIAPLPALIHILLQIKSFLAKLLSFSQLFGYDLVVTLVTQLLHPWDPRAKV